MSEANNSGDVKAPSAASLTEAVEAALSNAANHESTPSEAAAPDQATAVIAGETVASDAPASETVVGDAPASETAVSDATASDASETAATDAAATDAAATDTGTTVRDGEPAPSVDPRTEETKPLLDATAASGRNDELTAPRGFPHQREIPDGIAIRYFGCTDVGLVREHNEDNFLLVDVSASRRGIGEKPIDTTLGDRGCVLAVCDGMGGAAAGEVASQMAVDTIHEMMTASGPPKDRDHFARRLVRAVEEAGSRIFSSAKLDRSRRGMGTTSTVAGLVDSTLFVGQVGDSRAYILRGEQFALITKDQSLVNQLIEAGQLTEEEAEAFEHSNIILQALGTTEDVTVDLTFLELRRGDRLLLCSDGLSGLVHADMMKDVLRASRDLTDAAAQLIAMANAGGGHDNITVIVAEFDGLGLKEADGAAKVAYQQYPLPPATPDTLDPPPPRPTSVKPSAPKPGADVKGASSYPPEANQGGMGRWWLVAVLVLLVLALLGAILLSMDTPVATETPATRTTLSSVRRAEPTEPEGGALRFNGDFEGATLEVDGTPRGQIRPGLLVEVPAGTHTVRALRDGQLVASGEATVATGRHQFVELVPSTAIATGVEVPPPPVGVEPPPELPASGTLAAGTPTAGTPSGTPAAGTPSAGTSAAAPSGGADVAATERGRDEPRFVRQAGDLPHEPAPRAATP